MATTCDLVQVILEETPPAEGDTPVLSNDIFYMPATEVPLQPNPSYDDRSDEVRCLEGSAPPQIAGYLPSGGFNMRMYPNLLPVLFAIAGYDATVTPGDGIIQDPDNVAVPSGAYLWEFERRPDVTAQTAQVTNVFVDELQYIRSIGSGISTFTLSPDGIFSSDLLALVWARLNSDPNLTPVYDDFDVPNLRRGDLYIQWLADGAPLADWNLTSTNPLIQGKNFGVASGSYFPDTLEVDEGIPEVTGASPKTTMSDADLDAFMDATTFAALARWTSPAFIVGAYPYKMWADMPAVAYVSGTVPAMRRARRHPLDLGWKAFHDSVAGYDIKFTIVNATPSIADFTT